MQPSEMPSTVFASRAGNQNGAAVHTTAVADGGGGDSVSPFVCFPFSVGLSLSPSSCWSPVSPLSLSLSFSFSLFLSLSLSLFLQGGQICKAGCFYSALSLHRLEPFFPMSELLRRPLWPQDTGYTSCPHAQGFFTN
jgi:hypothetical protein